MNLLSISASYLSDDPRDIAGIFVHRQLLALKKKGWDARVISPSPLFYRSVKRMARFYPSHSSRDGVPIYRSRYPWLPQITQGKWFDRLYGLGVNKGVKQATDNWTPDIVVCEWIVPGGYAAAEIAEQFQVPLILRARGQDVRIITHQASRSQSYQGYYSWLGKQAKHILCNGTGLYQDLIQTQCFDARKLLVVPNGVDTDQFRPPTSDERAATRARLNLPPDGCVWLFVGRWEETKGTQEMTQVFKKLLPRHASLHFVAAGPILDSLRCEELTGSSDRVRFLGPVPPRDIPDLMRAGDALVLPSHREGMPNALLEAMACGLASVSCPVGGVPSILHDGVNGLLVEVGDTAALEDALERLTTDETYRRQLGASARHVIIRSEYNFSSAIETLHRVFTTCARQRFARVE